MRLRAFSSPLFAGSGFQAEVPFLKDHPQRGVTLFAPALRNVPVQERVCLSICLLTPLHSHHKLSQMEGKLEFPGTGAAAFGHHRCLRRRRDSGVVFAPAQTGLSAHKMPNSKYKLAENVSIKGNFTWPLLGRAGGNLMGSRGEATGSKAGCVHLLSTASTFIYIIYGSQG